MQTAQALDRLISPEETKARVGLSNTTIWRERRAGRFPQPVRVSPGRVAWRESEITDWIATRQRAAALVPAS
jgi:prophage regulatory protein